MNHFRLVLRGFALFTVLLLLLGSCPPASAEAGAASQAMDLIILIDDSNSMTERNDAPGSDPEKYRLEAAAIMLTMCEINHSRAAVISFGDERVREIVPNGMSYENGLIDISGDHLSNREKLVEAVKKSNRTANNTNVAAALQHAVDLFDRTPSLEGNQRVILLLSDGDPYDDVGKKQLSPDAAREKGRNGALTLIRDNPLFDPEAEDSVKIYAVKLSNGDYKSAQNDTYEQLAAYSDGKVFSASSANELPQRFSEMLASQIGSTLTQMKTKARDLGDGLFGIDIRIPNRSVVEANLLMSTEGVDVKSIRLLKPSEGNGGMEEAHPNGRTIFRSSTKSFVQYKIANESTNGTWSLQFRKDPKATVDPEISLTVLFSYQVQLEAKLSIPQQHALSAVEKRDALNIGGIFLDEAGAPSQDLLLYQPVSEDGAGNTTGIAAFAYAAPAHLKNPNSKDSGVVTVALNPSQGSGFAAEISLKDLGITKAGDYCLYLHAEGDGLVRDASPIPFTVINHPPTFTGGANINLSINDPNQADMNKPVAKIVDVFGDNLCYDKDAPTDSLTLSSMSLNEGVVRLMDENPAEGTFTVFTTGNGGSTEIALTLNDGDAGGVVTQNVPVNIVDVSQMLAARYQLELLITTPKQETGGYPIDTDLNFRLSIRDTSTNTYASILDYALIPSLFSTDELGNRGKIALIPGTVPTEWTGVIHTPKINTSIELDASVLVGLEQNRFQLALPADAESRRLIVGNLAPTVNEKEVDGNRFRYDIEPVAALGQSGDDAGYFLDLAGCFSDDDPLQDLQYEAIIVPAGSPDPASIEELRQLASVAQEEFACVLNGGALTLTPLKAGQYRLLAAVTDNSKQSAVFGRDLTVVSLTAELYRNVKLYGSIAAGVAALAFVLWLILRPRFDQLSFEIIRDGSFQTKKTLPRTQKKISLAAFASPTALQGLSIPQDLLNHIFLKPTSGRAVKVRLGKSARVGIAVMLNGHDLKVKKTERLAVGGELMIRVTQAGSSSSAGWKLRQSEIRRSTGMNGPDGKSPQLHARKSSASGQQRPV